MLNLTIDLPQVNTGPFAFGTQLSTGNWVNWYKDGARANQIPPDWMWATWLILAGRGWGKTRTANEWAIRQAVKQPGSRGAIVSSTSADTRDIIVKGQSGILNIAQGEYLPAYNPSSRSLTWPNGSSALLFSAERPDRLRGPQFHWAVCDELAAWKYPETWDMLMFGLRLGQHPQVVVATTPRPTAIIKELVASSSTHLTRGNTFDNADNLAPLFLQKIAERYAGTRLGRQEIDAEILDDVPGALWTRAMIDDALAKDHPPLKRIVVAVDPQGVKGEKTADTGIVVAGIDADDNGYVLEDLTINGSPGEWASRALLGLDKYDADRIIAESNHGGDMVEYTIRTQRRNAPVTLIRASRGKYTRAEPIAAFYEQGRIKHVGSFPELEDQLVSWAPGEDSPDRLDALVWALTDLMPLLGSREMHSANVDFYNPDHGIEPETPQMVRSAAEIERLLSG